MPNIRTFDTPNLGLNPSSLGTDSTAGAARRVGGFYNQVGGATQELGQETSRLGSDVGNMYRSLGKDASSSIETAGDVYTKYEDHKEISHGAATATDMLVNLENQWNDTVKSADPNDPSVAAKFRETVVGPALEDFTKGFTTENSKKFAEGIVERYNQHFATKTAADMSTMAGIAAKQNASRTINGLSSAVFNDPSSLPAALDTLKHSADHIVGSSPTLDAATAAKVGSDLNFEGSAAIVKSAVIGMLQKNPNTDLDAIQKKYGEFIEPGEMQTFQRAAKTYDRLAKSETRDQRVMADYTAKQDFHKAANDLELSTIPGNPMERPTLPKDYWQNVKKIASMPGASLEPGRLKSMVENGERITERLSKPEPLGPVSHDTTINMLNRIRATDATRLTSNDDIYKAYGDGKLNTTDFNFLQKEYADIRTPEGQAINNERSHFFKQYAGAIAGRSYDPVIGSPKLYAAEMAARRTENDLRRKGLDPLLAYDPTSEYFVGKPANIAKWAGSMQEDLATKATTPAKSVNLTADGSEITGIKVESIPEGMSPAEALKKYKSGTKIRLPDGRVGTVP